MEGNPVLLLIVGSGLLQGFFVAAILISRPSGNLAANRLLASLMILCSLNIAHPLITHEWRSIFPFSVLRINEPMQFMMAPLIAAYIRSLLAPEIRLTLRALVHFLPVPLVVIFTFTRSAAVVERSTSFPGGTVALWVLLLVQAAAYLIPSLRRLHRYHLALRNSVSNVSGIDLGWLTWLASIILGLYATYVVLLAMMIHSRQFPPIEMYLALSLTVVVWALGYRGLLQREPPRLDEVEVPATRSSKYERSAVPEAEAVRLQEKLEASMTRDRLFLDPELSLSGLAERLGAARNQVSFVINQRLGRNFFDFVNEYRVNEVIRLMKDPARAGDKLLALAFSSGFNSKPTFNAVFKKVTGVAPSEYRSKLTNRV